MHADKPFSTLYRILVLGAPIEAQVVVTRRCNLRCGYCYEHDTVSPPVAYDELCRRIDALHRLKVVHITFLGGEPLMHPRLPDLVAYGRRHSNVSITTNGFLLSEEIIQRLNDAGLNHMQISIDSLNPDPANYIQKSFKALKPKLLRLKRSATFDLQLAAVLCERSHQDIVALLEAAKEIGIPLGVSVVHDEHGQSQICGEPYTTLYRHYGEQSNHPRFGLMEYEYMRKLLERDPPLWRCRAGARSLYVDEFGKVQFCSCQRGRLDKPLAEYTWRDIRANARTSKGCERGCAVDCVYRTSQVDNDLFGTVRKIVQAL